MEDKENKQNLSLRFRLTEQQPESDPRIKELKRMLLDVGVSLYFVEKDLYIDIMPEFYNRVRSRNAGRKKKRSYTGDTETVTTLSGGSFESHVYYRYSDIVLMMQTLRDKELADKIGMKISTYYRHKKAMKESSYYKSLDPDRLRDSEYLKSVKGDFAF